jgi:hypothetical protein
MGIPTPIRVSFMHLSILGPTTPHTGLRWGLVGIIHNMHVNFDPRGRALDVCRRTYMALALMASKSILVAFRDRTMVLLLM